VDPAILEVDLGAEHEIFHRPRYEDLARCRASRDPGADPSEIVTPRFAFSVASHSATRSALPRLAHCSGLPGADDSAPLQLDAEAGPQSGTLRRLVELPSGGHPVLSVYLDLDSEFLSTPAARDEHLGSLQAEPELSSAALDVDRIQTLLSRPAEAHARRARAGGLLLGGDERVGSAQASRGVRPLAVLDTMPWLEPLADFTTCENWGVAVVSHRTARLFRGGMRALAEFAAFDAHDQVRAHAQRVAARLSRAHRRRPFANLAIVALSKLRGVIDASLDEQLTAACAAFIDADLERASALQLVPVLAPTIDGIERTRERRCWRGSMGRTVRPTPVRPGSSRCSRCSTAGTSECC
jgi:Protein required for attachment to host cells